MVLDVAAADIIEPAEAAIDSLRLVHSAEYLDQLASGTLAAAEIRRLGVPWSQALWRRSRLAAQGTIEAARAARADGLAGNLAGGTHHAFPGHGEGFCALNDVAIAIRLLQREGALQSALVVDLDVHQGNGTAAIFAGDPTVFTFSMHGERNYPLQKMRSTLDVGLADGIGDEEYLARLREAYLPALSAFAPQLVVYVAGADPYCQDQLGGLALSFEGLKARDRLVLASALMRKVPVVVTLAGGYAVEVEDTVTIHANTAKACKEALERVGWKR